VLDQGGLADASLAAHQDDPPRTAHRVRQRHLEIPQRRVAVQQAHRDLREV